MEAYLGSTDIKASVIDIMQGFFTKGALIQRFYHDIHADAFRGCLVGCLNEAIRIMRGRETALYYDLITVEDFLGIPENLAKTMEVVFGGLPAEVAPNYAIRMLGAIRPGADLTNILPQLRVYDASGERLTYEALGDQLIALLEAA